MRCGVSAPLDQRAGDAALPELDRERHADRPAADDDDLMAFLHAAAPRAYAIPNSFCALRKQIFSMSAFDRPSELSTLMVSRM